MNGQSENDDQQFLIGSRESEFICVRPTARTHANSDDYWDGNWLDTNIQLAAGAFRARYDACLRVDELIGFRDQLATLHETLDGQASFDSMEDWLRIQVHGDGLGHFDIQCRARDDAGVGNTLEFSLSLDQTQIPDVLEGLNQIIQRFPLIGSRDE